MECRPEVTDDPKYPHIIWKRLRGPYDRAFTKKKQKSHPKGVLWEKNWVQRDGVTPFFEEDLLDLWISS